MSTTELPQTDRRHPRSALLTIRVLLIVFFANTVILVLQVAAVRQLAPLVGNSLDTWTAIIGMFLAGISLGNYLGGRLADRHPGERTMLVVLLASAVTVVTTIGFAELFQRTALADWLPLYPRIALISLCVCFPAPFVLSLITPLAIRLALPDVRRAGRVVGLVYALGTLGSLQGNFLTGFVLLAHFTINAIILGCAAALLLLCLLSLGRTRRLTGPEGRDPGPGVAVPSAAAETAAAVPHDAPTPWGAGREGQTPGRAPPLDPPPERDWSALRGNVALGCLLVVVASFCTMALELTAPRMLAPKIGISLYSFTAIVGVCLAGIALGNFLGGVVGDLFPRQSVLSGCLLLAGLAVLVLLIGFHKLPDQDALDEMPLIRRVVLCSAVFFPPLFLLSMVSPQVIRLALSDVRRAGRTAGVVYAFSCLGALAGTFATGWFLISVLGTYRLVFLLGVVVLMLAAVAARVWRSWGALLFYAPVITLAVAGVVKYAELEEWATGEPSTFSLHSPFTAETNYYSILVEDDFDQWQYRPVVVLTLDHLIHSMVDPDDPYYLGYEHERVQAEMTYFVAGRDPGAHVLLIGGGGYTYPRWAEKELPELSVEVVEIDPGVTEVAHEKLGLPRDTGVVSHHMDGRQFVAGRARKGYYSLVIQDAVNDLSVPFHLMTKEYNEAIAGVLTDDGIYLLTVIDKFESGQLMRAAIRTLMETFPHVHLLEVEQPFDADQSWDGDVRAVYVIYASRQELDLDALAEAVNLFDPETGMQTVALEPRRLRQYVDEGPQVVLTDQYAPVDNLISILFRE